MRHTTAIVLAATAGLLLSTNAFAQSKDFDLTGFDRVDIATGLDARVALGQDFSVNAQSLPGWVHSTGAKTFPALGGEPDIY